MEVKMMSVDEITPYASNPRKNNKAVKQVAQSIKDYGFQQPIVVDSDKVVIVGHTRLLAAKSLKLKEVPVQVAKDLTPKQARAYRIADNKTNEFAEWDIDMLTLELANIDDLFTGFDQTEIDDLFGDSDDDNRYTQKIDTPVYEPKGKMPTISDMFDKGKFIQLIKDIEDADIDDKTKEFLTAAATRHYVFNYSEIAEYYCHQSPEVQELMERSALVIIDYDKAIEEGYVHLTKQIAELSADEYE